MFRFEVLGLVCTCNTMVRLMFRHTLTDKEITSRKWTVNMMLIPRLFTALFLENSYKLYSYKLFLFFSVSFPNHHYFRGLGSKSTLKGDSAASSARAYTNLLCAD